MGIEQKQEDSIWLYPLGPGEWTTWFNIDHPGGQGDYERLDAIRFYYGERVCARPLRLEARTTDWMPAGSTGQVVHGSPREGFWCLNREQRPGQNCSNYTVRFLCPPGESEWLQAALTSQQAALASETCPPGSEPHIPVYTLSLLSLQR